MESFTHADVDSSGHNLLQGLDDEDQVIARGNALVKEGKASCWPLLSKDRRAAALPSAKRNKEKDWEGSATRGKNVIELSSLYKCFFCKVGCPQASFMANVNADMAFVSCSDPSWRRQFAAWGSPISRYLVHEPHGRKCATEYTIGATTLYQGLD